MRLSLLTMHRYQKYTLIRAGKSIKSLPGKIIGNLKSLNIWDDLLTKPKKPYTESITNSATIRLLHHQLISVFIRLAWLQI